MTNTEMWLDETISHIKSIKSDIWMLHEIMSLPNCNDCKNKDCEYKPKWGEHIRYNCFLHNADRKTENSSEKPNNCEDEPQTVRSNLEPFRVDEPQTDNGIGCSRCEGRFDCYDRDMPYAVRCNNYGKITDEPQTERSSE